MKKQLSDLQILLKFVDPEFYNHLGTTYLPLHLPVVPYNLASRILTFFSESNDSSNMFFCFRWLLILFKREFSFSDVMRLWEVSVVLLD